MVKVRLKGPINVILLKVKASSVFQNESRIVAEARRCSFFSVNFFRPSPTPPPHWRQHHYRFYLILSFHYTPESIQQCKTFIKNIIIRVVWAARWFFLHRRHRRRIAHHSLAAPTRLRYGRRCCRRRADVLLKLLLKRKTKTW